MALLPQWNAFTQGVVCIAVGIVVLLAMAIVRRKMVGAPKIKVNAKTVGTVIYVVFSALVFGVGMCMTMVWSGLMVWGIVVGIVGIALLLGLIPMIKGIK
jgi:asparagine N-glycosylation enzyme membrane subunit Stt3